MNLSSKRKFGSQKFLKLLKLPKTRGTIGKILMTVLPFQQKFELCRNKWAWATITYEALQSKLSNEGGVMFLF